MFLCWPRSNPCCNRYRPNAGLYIFIMYFTVYHSIQQAVAYSLFLVTGQRENAWQIEKVRNIWSSWRAWHGNWVQKIWWGLEDYGRLDLPTLHSTFTFAESRCSRGIYIFYISNSIQPAGDRVYLCTYHSWLQIRNWNDIRFACCLMGYYRMLLLNPFTKICITGGIMQGLRKIEPSGWVTYHAWEAGSHLSILFARRIIPFGSPTHTM